jgi:hypothetical protein
MSRDGVMSAKATMTSANEKGLEVLKEISSGITHLGNKLDRLIELQHNYMAKGGFENHESALTMPFDVDSIVSLPDHLTKTAMVIAKLQKGTALEVSKETGRARAAESDYLNQLVSMGYLKKKRSMRKVVFYIEE